MRFLLMTFSLPLFLVANASPSSSPQVASCIDSMNDLTVKITAFVSNSGTVVESARNDPTTLSTFLESGGSNGFGSLDTGFQQATEACKTVTFAPYESAVATQAFEQVVKSTDAYVMSLVGLKQEVGNIGADKVQSAKMNLKKQVAANQSSYQNFETALKSRLPPPPPIPFQSSSNPIPDVDSEFKAFLASL